MYCIILHEKMGNLIEKPSITNYNVLWHIIINEIFKKATMFPNCNDYITRKWRKINL